MMFHFWPFTLKDPAFIPELTFSPSFHKADQMHTEHQTKITVVFPEPREPNVSKHLSANFRESYRVDGAVSHLKFRATLPQDNSYGLLKVVPIEFAKGLGPCGRWVTKLGHKVTAELLTIQQISFAEDVSSVAVEFNKKLTIVLDERRRIKKYGWSNSMAMTLSERASL